MLKNLFSTLQEAGTIVMDKAGEINDAAKEKIMSTIDEWVEILPKIQALGFDMTSFGISMSISPVLMTELKGKSADFAPERLTELMTEYKDVKSIKLFLNVIKTTLALHQKTKAPLNEILIVRIEVKLSPEIKVFLGKPELF
jgi:hypothetical protein